MKRSQWLSMGILLVAGTLLAADPVKEKAPIRVLLAAGGPSRDYQFVRALLTRELEAGRVDLAVYLQNAKDGGLVSDLAVERQLRVFPTTLRAEEAKEADRFANLGTYQVLIAMDLDWTALNPEQLALVQKWVEVQGGGLIVVAGSVHTEQLVRANNERGQLKPILDVLPVVLDDPRNVAARATDKPWRLHFPGVTPEMEFLKLDEKGKSALAGWSEFFTGQTTLSAETPTRYGFYSYYPVKDVKPAAVIAATFGDPAANLKNSKEQPYLVTMPVGKGKAIYVGSLESWRLRQARESFHERFWTGLIRYAAASK